MIRYSNIIRILEAEYLYSYSYSGDFLKPNIIRIRIRVFFQTEYYLYLYSGDFLKPNTAGNFSEYFTYFAEH